MRETEEIFEGGEVFMERLNHEQYPAGKIIFRLNEFLDKLNF